ncbi:MAG TPA: hypothetical protein DHV86_01890 [Methylophilaceae bacterium]|jgi:hypothetical protein|nr:hypothetical protein [Methylophilaceae bacterium]
MFRVLLLLFVLYGCSAQYHLNKAIKKGYTCEQTGDTIRITTLDSIPVIVNDTIVWEKFITTKDTIIKYNTVYVPKTRQDKRIEYKIKVKTIYKDRIVEKAQAKAEGKKNQPKKNFFWLGVLVGVLLSIIISLLWKIFVKKALHL